MHFATPAWAGNVFIGSPVVAFQILRVPSLSAEASILQSGEYANDRTVARWPARTNVATFVFKSHILTSLSSPPVARLFPSFPKARAQIIPSIPPNAPFTVPASV